MKTRYQVSEMEHYRTVYHIDEAGAEWCNYDLPDGWQIGCIEGRIDAGKWIALRDGDETEIEIVEDR